MKSVSTTKTSVNFIQVVLGQVIEYPQQLFKVKPKKHPSSVFSIFIVVHKYDYDA